MRVAKEKASRIMSAVIFAAFLLLLLLGGFLLFVDFTTSIVGHVWWQTPSWGMVVLSLAGFVACFLYFHQVQSGMRKAHMPASSSATPDIIPLTEGMKPQNIGDVFSQGATESVERAYDLMQKFGHATLDPLHLFIGAIDSDDAHVVFSRLGIEFDDVKDALGRRLNTRQLGKPGVMDGESEKVLLEAFYLSLAENRDEVPALEILAAAFAADEFLKELMLDKGVDEKMFNNMIEWMRIHDRMRNRYKKFREASFYKPTGAMNRSMTSVATPMLDAVSEDLTTAAVNGRLPMMIDRDREVEEIFRIIEGGRQSVVLSGPEGVGKSSILAGIAQLMVEERVPKVLQDKRLVRISIPHLVSGVNPAQAQERMLAVLSEVSRSRNIILAVSDIDQMVAQGVTGATDLAATFVDFLNRGGTFAIATTTSQNYTALVERSILGRVFQKVDVLEPDQEGAIRMLQSKIGSIEYEHKVIFSYESVAKAVELSDRYMHESYLPKKAIEISREVALDVAKTHGENALVTGEDVAKIITSKTGIKATAVQKDEKETLLALEERMHGRVIGQDEAVKAVASALRRARTELTSQARPIATFLFLGSTGVGKTELAKTVAEAYFGSEDMMIRMDMSEYQDPSSIHRMIGAPGSGEGGLLTEAVRKKPFSILLLDELEKAHPDILNIFLQVFDDGRLTDAAGRTIDFTNTIIISTSNAGTQYIQDAVAQGETQERMRTHLMEEELKGVYRPEFLNRFDGIIVFKPLTQENVHEITKLFMAKVAKRLEPKGIGFRATDDAVKELAEKGYDPKFGARPLRRVVQEEVDNAIANALLEGTVRRRDTIVLEAGGKIRIEQGEEL
jgi:ATP-dependent Clp protease ATP-binding subunit ClpC